MDAQPRGVAVQRMPVFAARAPDFAKEFIGVECNATDSPHTGRPLSPQFVRPTAYFVWPKTCLLRKVCYLLVGDR